MSQSAEQGRFVYMCKKEVRLFVVHRNKFAKNNDYCSSLTEKTEQRTHLCFSSDSIFLGGIQLIKMLSAIMLNKVNCRHEILRICALGGRFTCYAVIF